MRATTKKKTQDISLPYEEGTLPTTQRDWLRLGRLITWAIHDHGLVRYDLASAMAQTRPGQLNSEEAAMILRVLECGLVVELHESDNYEDSLTPEGARAWLHVIEQLLGWEAGECMQVLLQDSEPRADLPTAQADVMWENLTEPPADEDIEETSSCSCDSDEGCTDEWAPEPPAEDPRIVARQAAVDRLGFLSAAFIDALSALDQFEGPTGRPRAVGEAKRAIAAAFADTIEAVASEPRVTWPSDWLFAPHILPEGRWLFVGGTK